jgi:gamma-D-glutamyl-L-lysine dipeptidyl-peptidase
MSTYGICELTLIPVRIEPAERSEMVTQILYGETVEILETHASWTRVHCHFDGYEGWVTTKMLTSMDVGSFDHYQDTPKVYLKEAICRVAAATDPSLISYLAGGSTLIEKENEIMYDHRSLILESNTEIHHVDSIKDITGIAYRFLHAPYLWGGRTLFGIDCSGFTQIVFKMNGLALARDAYQQAKEGISIPVEEIKPGDLAFFDNDQGRIIHTGIILENGQIIHASGKVRIDKMTTLGIINSQTHENTHRLHIIKRMFN